MQLVPGSDPLTSPGVWDFSQLDAFLPPIQSSGDHSPEFQIAGAPAFMNDANGNLLPSSYADFAAMSANLVATTTPAASMPAALIFKAPARTPSPGGASSMSRMAVVSRRRITSISTTPMVPAMAQADPSIKFAAVELSDWAPDAESFPAHLRFQRDGSGGCRSPRTFIPPATSKPPMTTIFPTVLNFASEVSYIYSELATQPNLAAVPVWVTENNVNCRLCPQQWPEQLQWYAVRAGPARHQSVLRRLALAGV